MQLTRCITSLCQFCFDSEKLTFSATMFWVGKNTVYTALKPDGDGMKNLRKQVENVRLTFREKQDSICDSSSCLQSPSHPQTISVNHLPK